MKPEPERQSQSEGGGSGKIEFSHHGHIPVTGKIKRPVHPEVVLKICPSVTRPDIPAGGSEKRNRGPQGEIGLIPEGNK